MKKLFFIVALFIGIGVSSYAQKAEVKNVEVKSMKVEKSRGENPNIKTDMPTTDVAVPKPEKSRGENCDINIDNYTGYTIKVYVDGNYKGIVSPWEDGDVTVAGGFTRIYCVTAGGTYEWKAEGDCRFYFHYKLSMDNAQ